MDIIKWCPHCGEASRIDLITWPNDRIRKGDRNEPSWVLRDNIEIKCPLCEEWIEHEPI